MKRLAIIDIGSNSIHLVLIEMISMGTFKIIDDLKESVRLGADILNGNKLNEERINKAISTLKGFKAFCDAVNVEQITTVATEAVRKAENNIEFINLVKKETGMDIRILSGYEEAYYDALGVTNSMFINNSLIIDIGGSSTELVWIFNNQMMEFVSLPFGAVNLTQRFSLDDIILRENEEKLCEFLLNTYKSISWLFNVKFDNIIGIGGTVRNLGKIDRRNKGYCLDIHHSYQMQDIDIYNIYNSVKSKNLKQRRKIDGLSKDRADIFVAPTCAITTLLDLLKIKDFIVSGKGLREGLLYEYISKN